MSRRSKRESGPAPLAVKLFWGGAVAVVMVLGPLMLLRADFVRNDPMAPDRVERPSTVTDLEDRLEVDVLGGRPWVAQVWAVGEPAVAGLTRSLQADGWLPLGTDEDEGPLEPEASFERRLVLHHRFERDGAQADAFVVIDLWAERDLLPAAQAFARAVRGRRGDQIAFRHHDVEVRLAGDGDAHLALWQGAWPDALGEVGELDPRRVTRGAWAPGAVDRPETPTRTVWLDGGSAGMVLRSVFGDPVARPAPAEPTAPPSGERVRLRSTEHQNKEVLSWLGSSFSRRRAAVSSCSTCTRPTDA